MNTSLSQNTIANILNGTIVSVSFKDIKPIQGSPIPHWANKDFGKLIEWYKQEGKPARIGSIKKQLIHLHRARLCLELRANTEKPSEKRSLSQEYKFQILCAWNESCLS